MKTTTLITLLSAASIFGNGCKEYEFGPIQTEECKVTNKEIRWQPVLYLTSYYHVITINCHDFSFSRDDQFYYNLLNEGDSVLVDFRKEYELIEEEDIRRLSGYEIITFRLE